MLKNYIKVAFRNLKRDKLNTFINVLGLSLGFASIIVIFIFVHDQLTYDQFHKNFDRLYRLTYDDSGGNGRYLATSSPPMGKAITSAFPEVERSTLYIYANSSIISTENIKFYEDNILYADSNFLEVFTFPLIEGNPQSALDHPNSIIISEAMAEKYFGKQDPMGKILSINETEDLEVKGVFDDLPSNSHIQFDFLVSVQNYPIPPGFPVTFEEWGWVSFHTFLLLKENADAKALEKKLPAFFAGHTSKERAERVTLRLQGLNEIYFNSKGMLGHRGETGNINHVYGLTAVAILILVIAGFNFMNITTAQSIKRNKEVGVRKVLGAGRNSLLLQYVGESIVIALISLLFGLLLVVVANGFISDTFGDIFHYTSIEYLLIFLVFLTLSVFFGIIAGFYPALIISKFQPVSILKGTLSKNISHVQFRQVLIFFQFTVTIGIIAGSLIISRQMSFIHNLDPGFDNEQVLALHLKTENFLNRLEAAKNELAQNPNIVSVSAGDIIDGANGSLPMWSEDMPEEVPGIPMNTLGTYYDYFKTMGIQFEEGRPFSESIASDSAEGVVLNRAAAQAFGFTDNAIGKFIWVGYREGKVLGITEDFHYNTIHEKVQPLVMFVPDNPMEYVLVRTREGKLDEAITSLKENWKSIAPDVPFEYFFTDTRLNELYKSEERFSALIGFFSVLSVFVACLGLYGLVSIMVQYKVKEIGIRKVLGASTANLTTLLSKQFIFLILGANIIAWPLAYFYMGEWLSNFAYKIDISLTPFVTSAGVVLLASILTISYHGIKASSTNPIKSLNKD